MLRPDGLAAIDFDDCGFGFHAYDLAVPLAQVARLCEDRGTPPREANQGGGIRPRWFVTECRIDLFEAEGWPSLLR